MGHAAITNWMLVFKPVLWTPTEWKPVRAVSRSVYTLVLRKQKAGKLITAQSPELAHQVEIRLGCQVLYSISRWLQGSKDVDRSYGPTFTKRLSYSPTCCHGPSRSYKHPAVLNCCRSLLWIFLSLNPTNRHGLLQPVYGDGFTTGRISSVSRTTDRPTTLGTLLVRTRLVCITCLQTSSAFGY